MEIISFKGKNIAVIVRGKMNDKHEPGLMEQHADCILPTGAPIGFFGAEGAGSSGDRMASSNNIGMNMIGDVYKYKDFQKKRPYYVDSNQAVKYNLFSTVLILTITAGEAKSFTDYWNKLKATPGTFSLLGANCSTHASESFVAAGILTGGISGLDTPNNLFLQLKENRPNAKSYSGYIGFTRQGATDNFNLIIKPYIK